MCDMVLLAKVPSLVGPSKGRNILTTENNSIRRFVLHLRVNHSRANSNFRNNFKKKIHSFLVLVKSHNSLVRL
ncbi:UNVERIFIED_CONTAM: hypothetical protein RMT77_002541 [Armadillidium vulgare]